MCLVTAESKPFKVTEKKECYKVVRKNKEGDLKSLFYEKSYKTGEEYEEKAFGEGITFDKWLSKYYVENGFHSYMSFNSAKSIRKFNISNGWYGNNCIVVIRCEIPKGSLCYADVISGEYCSNRIRVCEIVNLWDCLI